MANKISYTEHYVGQLAKNTTSQLAQLAILETYPKESMKFSHAQNSNLTKKAWYEVAKTGKSTTLQALA